MDCFCTILHYLNAMGFLHQGIRTVIPRYVLQLFAVAWFLQSVPCLRVWSRLECQMVAHAHFRASELWIEMRLYSFYRQTEPNQSKPDRTNLMYGKVKTNWAAYIMRGISLIFCFLHCLTENIYRPKARQLRIFVFGLAFKPKLPGWARDYCVFFVCVCLVVVGSLLLIKWLKWQSKSVGRNRAAKPKPGQESLCQCRALSPPLGISESPNLRHLICCFGLPHKFALETRDPRLEVYSRRFCKRVRVCQVSIALSSSTWVRKLEIRKMKTYNNRQQGLSE